MLKQLLSCQDALCQLISLPTDVQNTETDDHDDEAHHQPGNFYSGLLSKIAQENTDVSMGK